MTDKVELLAKLGCILTVLVKVIEVIKFIRLKVLHLLTLLLLTVFWCSAFEKSLRARLVKVAHRHFGEYKLPLYSAYLM